MYTEVLAGRFLVLWVQALGRASDTCLEAFGFLFLSPLSFRRAGLFPQGRSSGLFYFSSENFEILEKSKIHYFVYSCHKTSPGKKKECNGLSRAIALNGSIMHKKLVLGKFLFTRFKN